MEGEVGAHAAPIFLQTPFLKASHLTKKHDFPWKNASVQPNPKPSWNPQQFGWDSMAFSVRPSSDEAGSSKGATFSTNYGEDGENLTLKLGRGGTVTPDEDPAVGRPSKKVRSGSPGSTDGSSAGCVRGGSYPMCQVDDCRTDLSSAKDYHRRHKVCQIHSKTTKALVGTQMQRFCQQCSRFHLLPEFDEGKRSCRRRLAGHNRRRRKTQPVDASSHLLPTGNQANNSNGSVDVVKLLSILTSLQGTSADICGSSIIPGDDVVQNLSKMQSEPTIANNAPRFPVSGGFDLNVLQAPPQGSSKQSPKANGNPSTTNLLPVVSAALATSIPDSLAALSQISSDSCGDDKGKVTCIEPVSDNSTRSCSTLSVGAAPNSCTLRSHLELSKYPVQEAPSSLSLQLFSFPEDDRLPKMDSMRKYISSESSNPMEERLPSYSPPAARKLFPLHSVAESKEHGSMSICLQERDHVQTSTSRGRIAALDPFKKSEIRVRSGGAENLPLQAGYTSFSGSDHSPSTSNSDVQDRTERIVFKLFDKDPSNFPGALRTQILDWLSNSPSEIESYIRPGCVVLSVYASMPSKAWNELEHNLLQRVSSLVQGSESEFWRSGRFMVCTKKRLASHKDGKIRLCKSSRTWRTPELTMVTPVAFVSGQETTLLLRGRNLTVPGTKIHCTFMGGYISKEVLVPTCPGTLYDASDVESFNFTGGPPNVFGRCFIEKRPIDVKHGYKPLQNVDLILLSGLPSISELQSSNHISYFSRDIKSCSFDSFALLVENGLRGNSFPVIIADANICQELRDLENEFEARESACVPENLVEARSMADVLHFLNELGWLFQRENIPSNPVLTDFSSSRFEFLFTFSVERDWVSVVRTLLDMLAQRALKGDDSVQWEFMGMLLQLQLLNRAVKRKCRKMVDLLLHYYVINSIDDSKMYLFPPNSTGPGGLTPLHLAASTQESEDMIDALTNDPQEIGLHCWSSIMDDFGQSPHMYASTRNNHSYNTLVARKLADRNNGHISVLIQELPNSHPPEVRSCARCALMENRRFKPIYPTRGLLQRSYVHSMLAIAAVCVIVCLFLRGAPQMDSIAPFKWENLEYGPR